MQAQMDPQQLEPLQQPLPSSQYPLCRIVFGSWEYRDLVVPLPISYQAPAAGEVPPDLSERIDGTMAEALRRVGPEGWLPDGPTDYRALAGRGRVKVTRHQPVRLGSARHQVESVSVRLRRSLPGRSARRWMGARRSR